MTRTILFRAKSSICGEMLEGYYYFNSKFHCLKTKVGNEILNIEIDFKTLGQFTGLYDKNKKMIFENDIVKYIDDYGNTRLGTINYLNTASFYIIANNGDDEGNYDLEMHPDHMKNVEVLGNIHDDDNLLLPF